MRLDGYLKKSITMNGNMNVKTINYLKLVVSCTNTLERNYHFKTEIKLNYI